MYCPAWPQDDVSFVSPLHGAEWNSSGRCRFIADHSDESVTTPAPGEEPWATYLGLPDSIIMLLADIVNLCADQPTENPYTVKSRADQIESALKEWKPTSLPSTAIIDSTALVSRTIAGQLWRLCAMVLLYQVSLACVLERLLAALLTFVVVGSSSRRAASRSTACPERDPEPAGLGRPLTQRRSMGIHRSPFVPRCRTVRLGL